LPIGAPAAFPQEDSPMSLGLIIAILPVIFLAGGFSGRFGGHGYGHGGISVVLVVMPTGRIWRWPTRPAGQREYSKRGS
jgi:hypothetical protein